MQDNSLFRIISNQSLDFVRILCHSSAGSVHLKGPFVIDVCEAVVDLNGCCASAQLYY